MLEKFFRLKEKGTNFINECRAGLVTFLTMSYIIFVQPAVLSKAGLDFGSVFMATIVSASLSSILMGIFTNYPFALAPGMGENFYMVYTACLGLGIAWPKALGAIFISGLVFFVLSLVGFREKIIAAFPENLRYGIAVGIGLMITLLGLEWAGIIVPNPGTIVGLGNFGMKTTQLALIGLVLIIAFLILKIRGAIFWGMIITGFIGVFMGLINYSGIASTPPSMLPTFFKMDFSGFFDLGLLSVIFVFFMMDLFDSLGTFLGLSQLGGYLDKEGKMPKLREALSVDALATMIGAVTGTSTVTTYVESAAGIADGGKTGLTAVVTGLLFLGAMFFAPLVKMIAGGVEVAPGVFWYPVIAPVLIIVGFYIMKTVSKINWDDITEALPAFFTIIMIALSVSITEGISIGFISYALIKILSGKGKEVKPLFYVFVLLFILRYFAGF